MSRFSTKKTGLLTFSDFHSLWIRGAYWLLFAFMLLLAFICLAPPLWVMLSSVKNVKEFYQVPPTIIPRTLEFEKIIEVWKKLNFFKFYGNTLALAAGNIVCAVLFNGLAGFVLSRLKPKGSKIVFMVILWTMIIPNSVSMIPLFKNIINVPLLNINLSNSFLPLWLMAGASAYYIIIFKSFFDGIPASLVEAARLDGCNNINIFARIIVPLSKPVIIVIVIFTLNGTWSDFLWPYLILKEPEKYTVMVKIFTLKSSTGFPMDVQMVALVFAIIPPAVLFMFFQRYIMQGFTLSGIKG